MIQRVSDELEIFYLSRVNHPWAINEHMPTLRRYARECEHITEFGVHMGFSTTAFLAGLNDTKSEYNNRTLIGYDIYRYDEDIGFIENLAMERGIEYRLNIQSSLSANIEPTDILFIDSLHNYGQIKGELLRSGNKARKYLIFHDTESNAVSDERSYGDGPHGILLGIYEFLVVNPHWVLCEHFKNQHGLTIFRRV